MAEYTATGTITEVKPSSGLKKDGSTWTRWSLKIQTEEGEDWFSTFSDPKSRTGENVEVGYNTSPNPKGGVFRNIETIKPATGPPPTIPKPSPNGTKPPTAVDYEDKKDRRTALMSAVDAFKNNTAATTKAIVERTEDFYNWLSGSEDATEAPREPGEPINDGESTKPRAESISDHFPLESETDYPDADSDPHGLSVPLGMTKNMFTAYVKNQGWTPAQIKAALGTTAREWIGLHEAEGGRDSYRYCTEAIVNGLAEAIINGLAAYKPEQDTLEI